MSQAARRHCSTAIRLRHHLHRHLFINSLHLPPLRLRHIINLSISNNRRLAVHNSLATSASSSRPQLPVNSNNSSSSSNSAVVTALAVETKTIKDHRCSMQRPSNIINSHNQAVL